jgi:hypothetical protein
MRPDGAYSWIVRIEERDRCWVLFPKEKSHALKAEHRDLWMEIIGNRYRLSSNFFLKGFEEGNDKDALKK